MVCACKQNETDKTCEKVINTKRVRKRTPKKICFEEIGCKKGKTMQQLRDKKKWVDENIKNLS